jgi:hypothetical protein
MQKHCAIVRDESFTWGERLLPLTDRGAAPTSQLGNCPDTHGTSALLLQMHRDPDFMLCLFSSQLCPTMHVHSGHLLFPIVIFSPLVLSARQACMSSNLLLL